MPTAVHDMPPLPALLPAGRVPAAAAGTGMVCIVIRGLAQGRRAGLASLAGVALGKLGNLGNATGTSIGRAALFVVSSTAFTAVK